MPRARNTDMQTSHAAAASVMGVTTTQLLILQIFETSNGLTDDELIRAYDRAYSLFHPAADSSIRSRRSELVERKMIRDTGKTRLSNNGRASTVWDIYGRLF